MQKILIAVIFCAFALPVFAGDGGDEPLIECTVAENDNLCLAKNTTCNSPGVSECTQQPGSGTCNVIYMKCQVECNICDTFECYTEGYPRWDNQWSADNNNVGYEKKEQKGIDTTNMCQEIVVATQYRCAAGYYSASGNSYVEYAVADDQEETYTTDLNCTPCPDWNGCPATSDAGAVSIVQCHVGPGCEVDFDDGATGSGKMWFTENCNHN